MKKVSKKKDTKPNKRFANYQALKEENLKEQEQDTVSLLLARCIVDIVLEIQALDDSEQNELIRNLALNTNFRLKAILKRNYDPLKLVLAKYGIADDLITSFDSSQDQYAKEKSNQLKQNSLLAIEGPREDRAASHEYSTPNIGTYELTCKNDRKKSSQMQLVPYKPITEANHKAIVDIERIRKIKVEKELKVERRVVTSE